MSQVVQTLLFDDVELRRSGKEVPADETVEFSLDGKRYRLDLTAENATKLRARFEPYTLAAMKLPTANGKASRPVARRQQSAEIRAWAKSQGFPVSERGRIPDEIMQKYVASH